MGSATRDHGELHGLRGQRYLLLHHEERRGDGLAAPPLPRLTFSAATSSRILAAMRPSRCDGLSLGTSERTGHSRLVGERSGNQGARPLVQRSRRDTTYLQHPD